MAYENRSYCRFGTVPELRTEDQVREFMDSVFMPVEFREAALARWRETRSARKVKPAPTEAQQDAERRRKLAALGELVARDAEQRASEDDKEDPEDSWESCPKCAGADIELDYDSESDSLDCQCGACGYEWNCGALSNEEISAVRQRAEVRRRMHAARGF
jgi:hypothetical protein